MPCGQPRTASLVVFLAHCFAVRLRHSDACHGSQALHTDERQSVNRSTD
jgi:hypothetical protein